MSAHASTGSPAAGWYPDPFGELSRIRYWDGREWTDHFQTILDPVAPQKPSNGAKPAPHDRPGR